MNDWKLALHVTRRQTVEIHRARIEITALAAPGQIKLRDRLQTAGFERIHYREIRAQAVVLNDHAVGDERSVPAPHPVVVQGKLAGRVDAAAKQPVARILVSRIERREAPLEGARIQLE